MAQPSIQDPKPRFSYDTGSSSQIPKSPFQWVERRFAGKTTAREWGARLLATATVISLPLNGGAVGMEFEPMSIGPITAGFTGATLAGPITNGAAAQSLQFNLAPFIPIEYRPYHAIDGFGTIVVNGAPVDSAWRFDQAGLFQIFNGAAGGVFALGDTIFINYNFYQWPTLG